VQVLPLDPETREGIEAEFKGDPRYRVQKVPQAARPPSSEAEASASLPDPIERDRIFQQAGVASQVRDWDAFEKDLLWIRSLKLSVSELVQKYRGKLSGKALKKLKALQKKPRQG